MFQILIVSFILFDVLWLILADRRLVAIRAPRWARIANLLFSLTMLAGISIAILLPRPLSREIQSHLPWAYLAAIFLWHLMIAPVGMLLLWFDNALSLGLWTWKKIHKQTLTSNTPNVSGNTDTSGPNGRIPTIPVPSSDPSLLSSTSSLSSTQDAGLRTQDDPPSPRLSRRELLTASLIVAPPLLLGITATAGLSQIGTLRVRNITVPVANLHPTLQGLRIAHISDTHYGRFTDQAFTDHLIETVNNLDADLHLVTGDLIDNSLLDLDHGLNMLRLIKTKAPIYCCVGNHDLFMSKKGFIDRVKASDTRLLVDENETLTLPGRAPIQIFGMDWLRSDSEMQKTATYLFRDKNTDAATILLAHHPHAFDVAAPAGIDLTLAGHTHGGQVMLSEHLGPGPMMYRYWSGLYRKQNASLVVSNGVGNWFPLRVNAPAEIVHITLTKA